MGLISTFGSSSMNGVGSSAGGSGAILRGVYNTRPLTQRHGVWERATTAERITTTSPEFSRFLEDPRTQQTDLLPITGLGLYDSSHRVGSARNQVPIEKFKGFVEKICIDASEAKRKREARQKKFDVLFFSMTPLRDFVTILGEKDIFAEEERVKYENETRIIVTKYGFEYVDLYARCGGSTGYLEGYVDKDGVHPGDKAHEMIAEITLARADELFDDVPAPPGMSIESEIPRLAGGVVLARTALKHSRSSGGVYLPTPENAAGIHLGQ